MHKLHVLYRPLDLVRVPPLVVEAVERVKPHSVVHLGRCAGVAGPARTAARLLVEGRAGRRLVRHLHHHQRRQPVDEETAHPRRHPVRGRLAVVDVEDDDGGDDGDADQDHGEEQVLAEQRHRQRRGRHDLGDEQEEHGLREQDGDAEGDLLAGVGRQVEDEHGEVGETDAGDDEVHRVEERLPAQRHVEVDI